MMGQLLECLSSIPLLLLKLCWRILNQNWLREKVQRISQDMQVITHQFYQGVNFELILLWVYSGVRF